MAARKIPLTAYGRLVKIKLLEKGMNQKEFVKSIEGLDETYFSKILTGERSGDKYRETIDSKLALLSEEQSERKAV
jgi:hypothetical protein